MIAAIRSAGDAAYVIGLLLVVGCLVAAAVVAFRGAWLAALVLCAVALVAAVLLL